MGFSVRTESQELLNCNPVWINDILRFIINILKIIAPVLMVVLSLSITPAIIPHCCSNWNLRSHIGHGVYCLHLTRTNSDHVSPGCLAPSLHWQLSHLRLQALMRLRVSCQVLTRSNDVHGHAVSRYREQKYRGLSALQCELLKKSRLNGGDWQIDIKVFWGRVILYDAMMKDRRLETCPMRRPMPVDTCFLFADWLAPAPANLETWSVSWGIMSCHEATWSNLTWGQR